MSIKAMMHVWQHSQQRGSALVVMLALADMANDDGECYPGKGKLSQKCRMTPRNLLMTINKLEAAGEIIITRRRNGNFNQSNVYRIPLGGSEAHFARVAKPRSLPSEAHFARVTISTSPDPLYKHHLNQSEGGTAPPTNPILRAIQERKQ